MFDRTQRLRRGAAIGAVALGASTLLSACGGNDNDQNSLEPKGKYASDILDLFTPFFWIATAIGIGVIGATIFVALRFREKPGEERAVKQTHGNTALEVGWTIVPALILAVMAAFTIPAIFDLAEKPPADTMKINVIGKQWFWEYEYCKADVGEECEGDEEIDFVTANELHVPVGKTIQLTIIAPEDGVIHSYWVPSINGKKDAVPGRGELLKFEVDEDKPGLYRGQCAEYCGLSHADMRIRVFAQTQADYDAWAEAERSGLDEGAQQYVTDNLSVDDAQAGKFSCTRCHAFRGVEGAEARIGPNLTHLGDRSTFASAIYETNLEELTEWVYDAPSKKPFGDYENAMPSFKDAGMTKDQAAEIARFLLCDTQTPEGRAVLEQFTPEVAQQHQEDCS